MEEVVGSIPISSTTESRKNTEVRPERRTLFVAQGTSGTSLVTSGERFERQGERWPSDDPTRARRGGSGRLEWSLDAPAPTTPTNFTVKRKRLPRWATPGLITGAITGLIVVVLVAIPLVVDTDRRYLATTLLLFGVSVPALAFLGYRILFGASRIETAPKVAMQNSWLGQTMLYRAFGGAWVVFVVGVVAYLRFIQVM